ncbi:HAD family hydrolase [Halosimplex halophilum]|uniref:HAD family hydrolase n=1 Tax=Halosimplex halophilum TaxID=2559572 RepID=UPI00107EFF2B|nr:HAD family hydrolase [Halosimplex halophilum]
MDRYEQLYHLYDEFDTASLRAYREMVDLFPPVDSPVALSYWEDASDELEAHREEIREAFPATGETYADIAARATRDQAFTGLDLYNEYGRAVSVLVLDVDETLRSAGTTDNEIPRETLHALTEFHHAGVPIVVCTGQTLENVKGFLIQGLGNEIVHSGDLSVVYESGNGVFTPGHGPDTKRLLYEDLDEDVRAVFDRLRREVFAVAPDSVRRGCHLQGNEFNVTVKPNFETGSEDAVAVIDTALVTLLDLLGGVVATELNVDPGGHDGGFPPDHYEPIAAAVDAAPAAVAAAVDWTRAYYAGADGEIREVLTTSDALPEGTTVPDRVEAYLDQFDVAYYEGDAAEVASRDLNKVVGVRAAFDVLGVDDPFALVLGDSKTDLRVMEWVDDHDAGIAAAPEHASPAVLDHVRSTDDLVFPAGGASDPLATVYALNRFAETA